MPTAAYRHCKILCTLGPASNTPELIGGLMDAGLNACRLNFSHGSHEDHAKVYATIRAEADRRGIAVAVLADLQGPKLRVGKIPGKGFELKKGGKLAISVKEGDPVEQTADITRVTTTYERITEDCNPGDRILMDDGNLEVVVNGAEGHVLMTTVVQGGILSSNKGINIPGAELKVPALTEKDRADLCYALDLGVDLVALSFVQRPADLEEARSLMREHGREVPLIAKVEKPRAVENMDGVIDACDGVMVARGDLGVEMGPESVPIIQKRLIEKCNRQGKLVITATQMLDSMIRMPRPTRAEASDVANAVLDGSDAVMLSGETATGAHPELVVRTMDQIVRTTEGAPRAWTRPRVDLQLGHTTNAIAKAAVYAAESWPETQAICCYTVSGGMARLVSSYRPHVPIIALTPDASTHHALALNWGIIPVLFTPTSDDAESMFREMDEALVSHGLLKPGAHVIATFAHPIKRHLSVNLLKLHEIGESSTPG